MFFSVVGHNIINSTYIAYSGTTGHNSRRTRAQNIWLLTTLQIANSCNDAAWCAALLQPRTRSTGGKFQTFLFVQIE